VRGRGAILIVVVATILLTIVLGSLITSAALWMFG
jgi:hypothetical protein